MHKFCQQCVQDISNNLPLSHCFYEEIDKINGITVFNASPGESILYKDVDGIMSHIKSMLLHHGKNPWILHIDGEGFETKHARQITIAFQFLELIKNEYLDELMLVEIICPTKQMHGVIAILWPFLPEKLKNIILIRTQSKSELSFTIYD
jgi:hypothetical protein